MYVCKRLRPRMALPIVLIMRQDMQVAGFVDGKLLATMVVALGLASLMVFGMYQVLAAPARLLWTWRKGHGTTIDEAEHPTTRDASVQCTMGMTREETRFQQEYVQRATELQEALSERCAEVRRFQDEVICLRDEKRMLERELVATRARRVLPGTIAVAYNRGERYHLPGCGNIRNTDTKTYTPCRACLGHLE